MRSGPSSRPKKLLPRILPRRAHDEEERDLPTGPDYVVLYQKNIEAVGSTEAETRERMFR
jgi:hypothetical protein